MAEPESNPGAPIIGPPAVLVLSTSAGPAPDGSVFVTMYGTASVVGASAGVTVPAFTGWLPPAVAQHLLTNLDAAILATAKKPEAKE